MCVYTSRSGKFVNALSTKCAVCVVLKQMCLLKEKTRTLWIENRYYVRRYNAICWENVSSNTLWFSNDYIEWLQISDVVGDGWQNFVIVSEISEETFSRPVVWTTNRSAPHRSARAWFYRQIVDIIWKQ